jgi:VWFA-related protein
MRHILRRSVQLASFVVLLTPPVLTAQEGQAVFRDTVEVEVVNVEVVVTDKEGLPVTGLTADDFRVLEDGEPVVITNFLEVTGEAAPGAGPDSVSDESAVERPPGTTREINLVVFVDNLNTLPSNRKLLFDNLREYLRTGAPAIGQVMVVNMDNRVQVELPFTSDMDAVFEALDRLEEVTSYQAALEGEQKIFLSRLQRAATVPPAGGAAAPGGGTVGSRCGGSNFEDAIRVALDLGNTTRSITERRYSALRATVATLTAFSSTLGGLPGRKALLYMSDGLSMRPNDMLREAWVQKYDSWYRTNERAIRNCPSFPDAGPAFQRLITGLGSSEFSLHEDFDRFTRNASDNQIAIYPISASGRGSSIISAEASGATGAVLRAARTTEAQNRDASMLQMADDTGGMAITSSGNIGLLLDQLTADFTNFYSIGYRPGKGNRDSEFHAIRVDVTAPGLEVRHSKGRHRKSWRDRLGDASAAAALFQIQTNPLDIRLTPGEPERAGKKQKLPLMVQIPLANVEMVSDGSSYSAELTVLVTVSDEDGGVSAPQRFDLPIQIPNAQILEARQQAAGYPVELLLEPGRNQVAVAVRDHIAQTASVLSIPVDVSGTKGKKSKKRKNRGK